MLAYGIGMAKYPVAVVLTDGTPGVFGFPEDELKPADTDIPDLFKNALNEWAATRQRQKPGTVQLYSRHLYEHCCDSLATKLVSDRTRK
jgi:hypothetical protein